MITRRQFLGLPLGLLLLPGRAHGALEQRTGTYGVDVGILYGALGFHLDGVITEHRDRSAGRYEVTIAGQGTGLMNRIQSAGVLEAGRWVPVRTSAWFVVYGREARTAIAYDHTRRTVSYWSRSETFWLRRVRLADDVVAIPEGTRVDDAVSAALNYADGQWVPEAGGILETHVVRRRRSPGEGVDDTAPRYRAELVPLRLRLEPDPATRRTSALLDFTRFSSWARESEPARIVFGPDRRPETITSSLMLGTSLVIRIAGVPAA